MVYSIDIMSTKAQLRQCLLAQRAMLTPAEIAHYSTVIAAYVCTLPAFCVSHTIMMYMALPQEVQTIQINIPAPPT
jgi:5-formyltetrahydrofolate cyclo-ligase